MLPIVASTRKKLTKIVNLDILTEIVRKLPLTRINKYLFILYTRFYLFIFLFLVFYIDK